MQNVEYYVTYNRALPPEAARIVQRYERVDERYGLKAVFFYLLWVACGVVMVRFPEPWVLIAGTLVIGTTLHGFGLFLHEALHLHMSHRSWLNHLVGFFSGAAILFSYSAYRFTHMRHHTYLRSKDDPDELLNVSKHRWIVHTIFYGSLVLMVPIYMFYILAYSLKEGNAQVRRWVLLEYAVLIAAVTTLITTSLSGGWFEWVAYLWFFPLGVAIFTANVRALSEHCLTGREPVSMARTIISNPIVRFFYSGENYHTVHHLAPKVPGWALKDLHDELRPYLLERGLIECPSYTRFIFRAFAKGPFGVDEPVQVPAERTGADVASAA